jgi:hypothetical protein
MPDGAWIGQLIAAIFFFTVGIRLARLASQRGERPERLLSNLFFFTGISYVLYLVPLIVKIEALWTPFNFAGRVSYIPAPIFLALFTRDVFRSQSRFSTAMIWATCALLLVGVGGSALVGDWEGFSLADPFFWCEWTGYTLPFAWAGLEAFVQYRASLRRQRLGLCAPIVCNRLLLWASFGAVQVVISFVLLRMYADFETNNTFSAFFDGLSGALESISIALIWLVFFPPRFYQKRISGSGTGDRSVEKA